MKKVELEIEERGKTKAKNLRREGYIPGILYGAGKKPVPFKLLSHNFIHFLHTIHGEQVIVNLKFKGEKKKHHMAILKDTQCDPVEDTVIHVDFQRVDTKKPIVVEVPFIIVGEAKGVKEGGILEEIYRSVEVEALVQDIPEHIEIDVSELGIGDSIHIGDIQFPEGIKPEDEPDVTIAVVVAPAGEGEEEEPEEMEIEEEETGEKEGKKAEEGKPEEPSEPKESQPQSK